MRAVNLIPIDEPAAQEVMLVPADEGAGNGSPSIVQRNAFIQNQAENPGQYIQQLSQHQVPTGYQTPDRAVVGMASPQDQQAADIFKREYVQKPASGVLARAARAIKLYAFPVAKAMDSINGNEDHQARLNRDIEELSGFIDQQQPGPEVGELGKFVRGVEELAPQVAIGGLGVANLLSSATADKGIDAVHQGIDPGTATVLAEKELLQNAAFMRAPQVGKTLPQSLAIGATVNPTLGTLGRAADRIILETADYQQQADAVKVIDPQTMAHEAAMGVLFSVDGHARNSLAKAHQPAEQARENAPPSESRPVELVPVDVAEPAAAARPEAGLDPESAAALKWAAVRLTDPTASKFERQSLKQMIAEPGRQELLRTYRRNQPHAGVVEEQQQKRPALPEAGREVELVPLDEQPAIENKAPGPVFDVQTAPEQGAAPKTQPAVQPAGQNQQIQQLPAAQPGTVEQIPAGKRGAADIYDLSLNPSHQRSLEEIRQAIRDGEAGGRVVIDQHGQGSTGQTVGYSSSFPDWFRNKGYGKAETLQAIEYALTGEGVTARQKIMLEDLMQAKRSQDTNQLLNERSQPAEVPAYRLNEGDTIKRNGELFKITEVTSDGVTLKDGETIHLNHEQTIDYDRGSLKDASGKLVKRSPEMASVEDNPFLDAADFPSELERTPSATYQQAGQHKQQVGTFNDAQDALLAELADAHARGGLTPDLVYKRMQELSADRVTGYQGATFHRPSLDRAWHDHQTTGRDFSYADIDLANLGGLNAHRGSNETANSDFREISRIIQEEVSKAAPEARFFRQGGDEMSVIAPDTPREALEAALIKAERQVHRYAAEQGLDQVPHPKHKPDSPHAPGVGIYFGAADFNGKNSVHDIIITADRATAAMKEEKGARYVNRSQRTEAGNQPHVASGETNLSAADSGRRSPERDGVQTGQDSTAEVTRQAAAQYLNEVIPEAAPAIGLSVGKTPRRDDTLKYPENQPSQKNAGSTDPEVEKRWQAAHGLSDGPGLIERGKAFLHRMLSETQHFPSLDTSSFSGKRTADILRRFESSDVAAKAKTTEYLHSLTASFGPKKMDIFTRKVILDDLIHEAEKGRALPFGYTPETVKADHDRISKLVEANPDIKAAVERRAEVSKHLVLELVDNDLLPVESVLTPQGLEKFKTTGKYGPDDINTQYFRHQVLEYANARKWAGISTAGEVRNKQRGWQKGREGSEQDINTNFLEAEFEYHSQALKELATKKALEEVLSINDIAPELREQAKKDKVDDWKTLIPEGHTVWQPVQGSVFYRGKTLPESIITKFLEQNPAFQDTMKKFKEVLILGGRKDEAVIPEGLAKTLDNLRSSRDDATLDTINKKLLATWKINTLLNPHRLLKYNLNNMSGDMDIVIAADPGIMKHFNTAWKNALNRHAGRAMGKDEIDMLDRGVIDAGLSINEIPDIAKLPGFQHLKDNTRNVKLLEAIRTGNLAHLAPLNLIKRYFDTVHGLSQVREGLLREAAYLRAKELMEQGKTIYWASKPAEISALPDIKDRAAKVSRDLLGDYGNISAHGEKIRHSLIPFWSWMEINAPRYYRLFKNAATRGEGGSTAALLAGVGTRKAAGAALGITEKLFLTNLLFASVSAFNHLMYPDEEARLGDSNRGMHIIMGSTSDGKVMSVKFQGAMADALSWFGLEDWPTSWEKLQNDQMSAADLFKKMALATPNKLANAAAPFFKLGAELITGKQIFPDITQPKPIRDRPEHVARFLALDEEYKTLAGKPTKGYLDSLKRNLIYEGDPGEIAYQDTRQRVMQFMKKQGKEIPGGEPTERANALFYFKQAVRYGDREAAARYKQEYLQAGGKLEGIRKSIDKAHPLALLPENMRYKFRQSLSPEEDQAFKEGLGWYREVYKP